MKAVIVKLDPMIPEQEYEPGTLIQYRVDRDADWQGPGIVTYTTNPALISFFDLSDRSYHGSFPRAGVRAYPKGTTLLLEQRS
jgi:hypothetical protein